MSEFSWWPGLIVLAFGLAGGLFMATRLRRAGKEAGRRQRTADLALEVADLEERRDDLYRRLRDESEALTESGRRQLEQSAARVLRDLEKASAELGRGTIPGRSRKGAAMSGETGEAVDREAPPGRRSLVGTFALGAGMVAIVALLIYWAVRDTAGTGTPSMAGQQVAHPETSFATAEAQAEYEALRAQLDRDPGDVMARKRLALLLMANDQWVPAFEEARALQERDPDDIDGLYVEAVVRLQMGQLGPARELLERVVAIFPDHVQAHAWLGIVSYQNGDIGAAVKSWERGIEAAGGVHPELEEMVTAALAEEAGLIDSPAPERVEAAPEAVAESLPQPVGSDGFGVRLELAPGVTAPPGVLFVALRTNGGGPPLAVRRISSPVFPLDLTLTAADSMMGATLPERGTLFARLDQDGDVSAASPGDLMAEAEVEAGATATLRLQP